jgi:hypothetical protein
VPPLCEVRARAASALAVCASAARLWASGLSALRQIACTFCSLAGVSAVAGVGLTAANVAFVLYKTLNPPEEDGTITKLCTILFNCNC